MIYQYRDVETGALVEIAKPASRSDPIDRVITHNGRMVRRIVSPDPMTIALVKDEPRARRNIPRFMPGWENTNAKGEIIATNAELKRRGFVPNPHLDNPAWK